jgi:peptide/nickel transport system substrate-binding protein
MAPTRPAVRIVTALGVAALFAGALAGCTTEGGGGDDSTLTLVYDSDAASFGYDPLEYSDGQRPFYEALYDFLAVPFADGGYGPGLATEFAYNEDGTELTLTLAEGVEFTDGSTLTADLVKANFDRRDDPSLPGYAAVAAGGAQELVSVDVVDDTHVTLVFAAPQFGFESTLATITGAIVGQTGIDDPTTLGTTPAGSGPYTLSDETVKGTSYVFDKVADGDIADQYAYDTVVIKPITDPQARVNAVVSGEGDAAFIITSTAEVAEQQGLGISQVGGTVASLLVFDKSGATSAPFADPNVRIALGYAIDREEFVAGVHPGETPAVNALPKDSPGFSDEIDAEYSYDPEKAKELLAAAGYPDGFEFDAITQADSQTDWEAIQTYFAEVGVTMNLKQASSTEEAFAAVQTTPLGLLPVSWANPVGIMFGVVLGFANPHGEFNPALIEATQAVAGSQGDPAIAGPALSDLNAHLVEDGWLIPLYEQLTTWTYNSDKLAAVDFGPASSVPTLASFTPAG